MSERSILRFIIVSDGHINHDSDNERYHNEAVDTIGDLHGNRNVDFLIYNGDTSQDEPAQETLDKEFFDLLPADIPYYVSYGNHEYIDSDKWEDWYGHPTDYATEFRATDGTKFGVLIVQSVTDYSDGHEFDTEEACPDVSFIKSELDQFKSNDVEGVFVFCHVAPFDHIRSHGNDCPDVREQFERDIVRAVFCGHDHSSNDMVEVGGQRYFYTNHLGNRGSGNTGIRLMDIYK